MPLANRVDETICVLDTSYRDRDAIRAVPGSRYRNDAWWVPLSWPGLKVLAAIFGDRLEVGESLRDWAWNEYHARVRPAAEYRELALDPDGDCGGDERLYPFQRTGVRFLQNAGSAILTDEMGTGKTVQAIKTIESKGAYPALVVAPKSAKAGWLREFRKWAPDVDVVSVGGSAARRRQALEEEHQVYVIHWDALRLHGRLAPYGSVRLTDEEKTPKELNAIAFGAVIADEAHRAVTPKAKQTRALWAVRAPVRIAMTGTPIHDSPADLWSLLHFVAPHEWPTRTNYIDRYCETTWNEWGGVEFLGLKPEHAAEFHELVAPRLLRRPKELVLPWLPPKVYERRDIEMPPKQARAYEQFKKDMVADLDSGTGMALDQLSVLTRLTQLASACVDVTGEEVREDGTVKQTIRLCAPSSKVDALVELLEDMGDKPLIAFAASRQLVMLAADRLEREGISHTKIVGGQSDLVRASAEADFMEGRARVILLTMGAGSEALTLTRADTLCFMQRSWSLIENRQAEDRFHRPGQEADSCTVVDLVAPGTVEEDQQEAVREKGERLEEIVRDREILRAALKRRAG